MPHLSFGNSFFHSFFCIPIGGTGIFNIKKKEKSYMGNTLNLAIEGMHCGACVRRVKSALQGVQGVTVNSVEVGSAKVAFDGAETSAQDITAALDRNGFPARVQQ
jgi:copper chaperone